MCNDTVVAHFSVISHSLLVRLLYEYVNSGIRKKTAVHLISTFDDEDIVT
jgi:hypothetical protein